MRVVVLKGLKDEFVTPKHSSAFGKLITVAGGVGPRIG